VFTARYSLSPYKTDTFVFNGIKIIVSCSLIFSLASIANKCNSLRTSHSKRQRNVRFKFCYIVDFCRKFVDISVGILRVCSVFVVLERGRDRSYKRLICVRITETKQIISRSNEHNRAVSEISLSGHNTRGWIGERAMCGNRILQENCEILLLNFQRLFNTE
jgi:hypothetical protein